MKRERRRGSALLEFALAGIPAIFLFISIAEMSRGMWIYHTLARAANQGARLASIRGRGCVSNGNTCGVTVGTIASAVAATALGVPSQDLTVTLVTESGQTTSCAPLSSCLGNATVWPPSGSSDNAPGQTVTVKVQYTFHSAIAMFWPGAGAMQFGTAVLPASATEQILF